MRSRIVSAPAPEEFQEVIQIRSISGNRVQPRKARKVVPAVQPNALLKLRGFQVVPLDWIAPRTEKVRPPQCRDCVHVVFRANQLQLYQSPALVHRMEFPYVVLLQKSVEWENAVFHRITIGLRWRSTLVNTWPAAVPRASSGKSSPISFQTRES